MYRKWTVNIVSNCLIYC